MGGPAPDPTQVRALVGQGRLLPAGYTGHGEGAGALKSSRLGWCLTAFPSRVAGASKLLVRPSDEGDPSAPV